MSYAAFVPCACYRDGPTVDPPHKEHVIFEEGCWDLNWGLYDEVGEDRFHEMRIAFEDWKSSACAHEDMVLVDEWLANTMGAIRFGRALSIVPDLSKIPILHKKVIAYNDGGLSPKQCRDLLTEIEIVREHGNRKALQIGLYRVGEKYPSYTTLPGQRTTFEFGPGREGRVRHTWLDETGIIVYEPIDSEDWSKGGYELFHSKKFAEVAYEEPQGEYVGAWVDVDTKHAYARVSLMSQRHRDDGAQDIVYFDVREEEVSLVKDIEWQLDKLERLAVAGIETGYGVYWA